MTKTMELHLFNSELNSNTSLDTGTKDIAYKSNLCENPSNSALPSVAKGLRYFLPYMVLHGSTLSDHFVRMSKLEEWEKNPQHSVAATEISSLLIEVILFDIVSGSWKVNTGTVWENISDTAVSSLLDHILEKKTPKGYSRNYQVSLLAMLKIKLGFSEWCTDKNLLPVKNGILDVKKRKLFRYSNEHRFNWQLEYSYDPKADCSTFLHFLNTSTEGMPDLVPVIRAMVNMIILGRVDLQKFFEIIGPGGTGKSTLVEVCSLLVGKNNQVTTDLQNLEKNRFETAALHQKRLIIINDSSRYGGEVAQLKSVTGQDSLRFEQKNKQQGQTFRTSGIVVIAANEPIRSSDYTSGLSRRRVTIPFDRRVTEEEKIDYAEVGGIETVIKEELPGVLNWALAVTDKEIRRDLSKINGILEKKKRENAIETNSILAWIDDKMVIDKDSILYVGNDSLQNEERLYPSYKSHCESSGGRPVSLVRFGKIILDMSSEYELGVEKMTRSSLGNRYSGLAFRNPIKHKKVPTPITNVTLESVDPV